MRQHCSTEAHELLLATYEDARKLHADVITRLSAIETACRSMSESMIMDSIYALKQANQFIDDTRLEVNRKLDFIQKLGCAIAARSTDNKLRGEWATGHAQVTDQPGIPHPDREPAEYAELMQALGASAELIEAKTMRPSFDAVGQLMATMAEQGKPMLAGFRHAKTIPKYTVVARAKHRSGLDSLIHDGQLDAAPSGVVVDDTIAF